MLRILAALGFFAAPDRGEENEPHRIGPVEDRYPGRGAKGVRHSYPAKHSNKNSRRGTPNIHKHKTLLKHSNNGK